MTIHTVYFNPHKSFMIGPVPWMPNIIERHGFTADSMDIMEQFMCAAAAVHRTMSVKKLCMGYLGLRQNRDIIMLQAESADLLNNFRLKHKAQGQVTVRFSRSVPDGEMSTDPKHEAAMTDHGEFFVPMHPGVFVDFCESLNLPQLTGGNS